ncbi:MAG: hypothetical protein CFE43_19280 [Burkholderiales bacterium PBB3]|nr:MAG: hypothetical protein CFE43_19280 [Burkholderiales bacterium PBB3]
MMGQGITPAAHHPVTRQMDNRDLSEFLGEIRKDAARTFIKLPKHHDFIAQFCDSKMLAAAAALRSLGA